MAAPLGTTGFGTTGISRRGRSDGERCRADADQVEQARVFRHLVRKAQQQGPDRKREPGDVLRRSYSAAVVDLPTDPLVAAGVGGAAPVSRADPLDLPWEQIDHAIAAFRRPLEPDLEPVGGAEVVGTDQAGMAIGSLKLFSYEDVGKDRFGAATDQLDDAMELGVDLARQYGARDLSWGALTDGPLVLPSGEVEWKVPTPIPVDEAEIEDLVMLGRQAHDALQPTNVTRFAELLVAAWRRGVRLHFTFFTLGGGSKILLDNPDRDAAHTFDPRDDDDLVLPWSDLHEPVSDWGEVARRLLAERPLTNVLRSYWSPDWLGADTIAAAEADPGLAAVVKYTLVSMDFTQPGKARTLRAIARACATLLVDAETEAASLLTDEERAEFALENVIDGIELGNECDTRNIMEGVSSSTGEDVSLVEETAALWTRFVVYSAIGFVEGFRAAKGSRWAMPMLYLPGLHSVQLADLSPPADFGEVGEFPPVADNTPLSWTWKFQFLDAVCDRLALTWRLLRGELPTGADLHTPYDFLPPIDELFGGIDLHWYHFQRQGSEDSESESISIGPLHAGWLFSDLQAISDLLISRGLGSRVTVVESSASADSRRFAVAEGLGPDEVLSTEQRLAFQANDTWRRLLAARAAGADRAGHHPWSYTSDTWSGCGLRETPVEDVEGAAADALAKPAHFAFHRAALLMWTAEVRCVLPAAFPSRSWLTLSGDAPNRPWEATPVFVFELEGLELERIGENVTVDLTWAYVLLVDPTAPSAGAHLVQIESADGRLGEVKRMEPWAENPEIWRSWTVDEDRASEATLLPRYRLVDSIGTLEEAFPGATRSVGLELFRGGDVVVLLSPVQLTVSMV